jgi:hypothetical protein
VTLVRAESLGVAASTATARFRAAAPVTPAPAAPRGPVTIALGQTTNQVVAMKGQSLNKVNFPNKMVYIYSDMKIIFVRGKVSDVQQMKRSRQSCCVMFESAVNE